MRCPACKKEIVFTLTKNGANMPVDASSLTDEDISWLLNRPKVIQNELLNYRPGEHVSHWGTCTDPDRFRALKK